jgi:hypothetical protein
MLGCKLLPRAATKGTGCFAQAAFLLPDNNLLCEANIFNQLLLCLLSTSE